MQDRTFQVKIRTAEGACLSGAHGISRALPRVCPLLSSGFLSPIQRHKGAGTRRIAAGEDPKNFLDLIYAGDVTTRIAEESRGCACALGRGNAGHTELAMRENYLGLNVGKIRNLLMPPEFPGGDIPEIAANQTPPCAAAPDRGRYKKGVSGVRPVHRIGKRW